MAIARWNPRDELTSLYTTMDRLFGDAFGPSRQGQDGMTNMFRLPVDIREVDNAYEIKAQVPGFAPEEIDLTVTGNVLTISARHKDEREKNERGYIRREVVEGNFVRQIALPNDAKLDTIKAEFENGELRVEVPRAQQPQPRKVQVQGRDGKRAQGQMTEGQQRSHQGHNEKAESKSSDRQPAGSTSNRT
jgi:HSP20 family protein